MVKIREQHDGQFMEEWKPFLLLLLFEEEKYNQMKSWAVFEIWAMGRNDNV